jgi:hypothetical protein
MTYHQSALVGGILNISTLVVHNSCFENDSYCLACKADVKSINELCNQKDYFPCFLPSFVKCVFQYVNSAVSYIFFS